SDVCSSDLLDRFCPYRELDSLAAGLARVAVEGTARAARDFERDQLVFHVHPEQREREAAAVADRPLHAHFIVRGKLRLERLVEAAATGGVRKLRRGGRLERGGYIRVQVDRRRHAVEHGHHRARLTEVQVAGVVTVGEEA